MELPANSHLTLLASLLVLGLDLLPLPLQSHSQFLLSSVIHNSQSAVPSDPTPGRSLEEPHPQRQKVSGGARGWGREGQGSECFMGAELQFGKMERSGDGMVGTLHDM